MSKTIIAELVKAIYGETVDDLRDPQKSKNVLDFEQRKQLAYYFEQNLQQRLEKVVRQSCSILSLGFSSRKTFRNIAQMAWRDACNEWLNEIEAMSIAEMLTHEDLTIRKIGRVIQKFLE